MGNCRYTEIVEHVHQRANLLCGSIAGLVDGLLELNLGGCMIVVSLLLVEGECVSVSPVTDILK